MLLIVVVVVLARRLRRGGGGLGGCGLGGLVGGGCRGWMMTCLFSGLAVAFRGGPGFSGADGDGSLGRGWRVP